MSVPEVIFDAKSKTEPRPDLPVTPKARWGRGVCPEAGGVALAGCAFDSRGLWLRFFEEVMDAHGQVHSGLGVLVLKLEIALFYIDIE